MKAVVMAGGEGTRLRPLTCNLPKPMVPILNLPIMHHGLNLLKMHGITEVCATLHYLPKKITDYFGNGETFGIHIHYFIEDKPLGTAGSVKNATKALSETFLVFSGDALTDIDITTALKFHRSKGSIATLILKRNEIPLEYGVVVTDGEGKIVRFLEKPTWREVFSDTVNTGIYILEREVLDEIDAGEVKDFSKDVFPALLKRGAPIYGYVTKDYWCDIGGIGSYIQANFDVLDGKCRLPQTGDASRIKNGLWLGANASLPSEIVLESPCFIGDNVQFGSNVKIGAYTVIGNCVRIGKGSSMKRTIAWDGAVFGNNTEARGAVICRNACLEDRARIFEGAVLGDDSIAGGETYIKHNILVWPEKSIENGSIVAENVVWDSETRKGININDGIFRFKIGSVPPERILAFARAYANCFENDDIILLCDDGSVPSQMVKQIVSAGMASQGIQCHDIGENPYQVACITMLDYPYRAGICIDSENGMCHVLLLGAKAVPVSKDMERKIQNYFERRDIPCKDASSIKICSGLEGMDEKAVNWIMDQIDTAIIYKNRPVLAVDDGPLSGFMHKCLKAAGCKTAKLDFSRFDIRRTMETGESMFGMTQTAYFGEGSFTLITREGAPLEPDKLMGLKLTILKRSEAFKKAVLPVNIPDEMVDLCKRNGIEPQFSKISLRDMMQTVAEVYPTNSMIFAVYFVNSFFILKLVEHILREKTSLEQMLESIPRSHSVQKSIPCTPKEYGKVMRSLVKETDGGNMPEGVKLNAENGWAFVLPDMESGSLKVFGHGVSEEYAADISETAIKRVKEYLDKNADE